MDAKQLSVFIAILHCIADELLQSYKVSKPVRTSYIDISEEEWELYRSSVRQNFPLGNQAVGQHSDIGLKLYSSYAIAEVQ